MCLTYLWIFLSWAQAFSWVRYKQHFNFFYNLVEQKKEGKTREKKKKRDEAADKKLLDNVGRELKNSPHLFDPWVPLVLALLPREINKTL